MSGIKIYKNLSGSANTYELLYTADNIEYIDIKKSTGVIQFSLPIVSNTSETSGNMVNEQCEFIHINGVEANVDLSFTMAMNEINTMLSLVDNKMSTKHKLDICDWEGQTSGYTFLGLVDSVRLRQEGGDPRVTCNLTFLAGQNNLADFGY